MLSWLFVTWNYSPASSTSKPAIQPPEQAHLPVHTLQGGPTLSYFIYSSHEGLWVQATEGRGTTRSGRKPVDEHAPKRVYVAEPLVDYTEPEAEVEVKLGDFSSGKCTFSNYSSSSNL